MKPLLGALGYAAANLLHPRMLWLMVWPMLVAAGVWGIAALEQPYRRQLAAVAKYGHPGAELEQFGWLLEELRVSLFAQELRTPVPVSVKRLLKLWQTLRK